MAVDIRWGSPSFGRHVAVVLSASEWNQIFIPEGFAHGYWTPELDTEVVYKVRAYYSPEHHRGPLWSDTVIRNNDDSNPMNRRLVCLPCYPPDRPIRAP